MPSAQPSYTQLQPLQKLEKGQISAMHRLSQTQPRPLQRDVEAYLSKSSFDFL